MDGLNSHLDADRLDGFDSSAFVRTAEQLRTLLLDADGAGSTLDADRLDGLDSTAFVSTGARALELLTEVDGAGSGLDADRLDGFSSGDSIHAGALTELSFVSGQVIRDAAGRLELQAAGPTPGDGGDGSLNFLGACRSIRKPA